MSRESFGLGAPLLEEGDIVAEERAIYGASEGFRRLRVWHAAMDLAEHCYRLAASFPASELYGTTSQLKRAAVSVPTNIAEGWGRNSRPEFARFIDIAIASLCEIQSLIALSIRLMLTTEAAAGPALESAQTVGSMLHGLRIKLRNKA